MSRINNAKFQQHEDNGDLLSGGKLYTYEAGTSTPKATYSDPALATANANPVVLDARGEADVYGLGTYKLVLKDSDDVTLWTVDNYTPVPLSAIWDSDSDTGWQAEKTTDEDVLRADAGGTLNVLTLSATAIGGSLVKDEDNMASDSASHVATQQSIKAYADAASLLSVPSGETITFYKDTAVTGYSLENGAAFDDTVAYISKGSVAGGQTGGTKLNTGAFTWTQPNHLHTGPSHNHQWYNRTSDSAHDYTYNSGGSQIELPITSKLATYKYLLVSTAATSSSLNASYTDNDGTGNTGNSATAASWRPECHCFTMQTRD